MTRRTDPGLGGRFHRLWTASTISNLADGIVRVGAPLVAVRFTRDPQLVAGVQVAMTIPWLLLALHIGALADRRDRRVLMIGGATLRALVLSALGAMALLGWLTLPSLYFALLLFGVAEVLFDTSAQSALPDVVAREQLGRANGRLIGAQTVMERFVGAPISGVIVATSLTAAFLGPAALYLLAAFVLVRLPGSYEAPARPPTMVRTDIVEGLRFLRGHATLRALAVLGGVLNLATTAYFRVFVLFVVGERSAMGLPEEAFGLLSSGLAVGSVVGSFVAGRLERRLGPRRLLIGSMSPGSNSPTRSGSAHLQRPNVSAGSNARASSPATAPSFHRRPSAARSKLASPSPFAPTSTRTGSSPRSPTSRPSSMPCTSRDPTTTN